MNKRNKEFFTVRCYASAVYAVVECICPSQAGTVPQSAKRITQTMPYDSPGSVVFLCQKSRRNSNGVVLCGGAKLAIFDQHLTLSQKLCKIGT